MFARPGGRLFEEGRTSSFHERLQRCKVCEMRKKVIAFDYTRFLHELLKGYFSGVERAQAKF